MMSWIDFTRLHEERGARVSIGTSELGLVREDALAAIDQAEAAGGEVLGGDVWLRIDDNEIVPAYANWAARRVHGEAAHDRIRRLADEARQYVSRFPRTVDREALFVLVVNRSPVPGAG